MSLFGFIVFIIVLSSTVFSLSQAQVNFLSTTNNLSGGEDIILSSAEFEYGESIFFIDKETYIEKIEVANPYIKVVGLEIAFPSKLIIHAVERNEMFAFKLSNNTYAIVDDELKVLDIRQTFVNTNQNAILIDNADYTVPTENAQLGTIVNMPKAYVNLIKSFGTHSFEWDYNLANLRGNIKSVTLNYEEDNQLLIEMRQGVQIVVKEANLNMSDKLQMAFSVYDSDAIDRTKGILLVLEQIDGEIVAAYDDGE
jgi:cell division septal protein FtsQ